MSKANEVISVIEKMALVDYTDYSKKLKKAYFARPNFDKSMVPSYKALIKHTDKIFKQIKSKIEVRFVDEDPYHSYEELQYDIKNNKLMKVWKGESDHPVFTPEQNWRLRAVHDWFAHTLGHHKFDLRGEIAAYNRHVKLAPPAALDALFTEVVGQAASAIVTGGFDFPQKIAKLHGFDVVNLGIINDKEYQKNFER